MKTTPFDPARYLDTPEAHRDLLKDALATGDATYIENAIAIVIRSKSEKTETIVAAAVQVFGVTMSLPVPKRHHHILQALSIKGGLDMILHGHPDAQGFVTSSGRFVGRREAAAIAIAAGQVTPEALAPRNGVLFSEDVW